MPHLDRTGPCGEGEKTGRKLGECLKTEVEHKTPGELGKGQGKRRKSGGGVGQGKRLNYNLNKKNAN